MGLGSGGDKGVQSRADHVIGTKPVAVFKQDVFFITEQDKQAEGGRTFEMVSHSTVDVHTRAAVVCTSRP